jgi:uncharacterized protein (TIGR02391 family)
MASVKNNPVINKLRSLHQSAVTLKEKFDAKQPNKVLEAYLEIYRRDLDELTRICPGEVLQTGDLIRHSAWLRKFIRDGKPESCYSDISDICLRDIFVVEEAYFRYLTETESARDKFYDWQNIHPVIQQIAKPRFESQHFADAVEASFKEINELVKAKYRSIKGEELDGDKLMRNAFTSTSNNGFMPVIPLADNSGESGRNIQQGYMDIFAGAMKGIRNPKAHANVNVDPDEAWEMIVLASHLMRMWDKFN